MQQKILPTPYNPISIPLSDSIHKNSSTVALGPGDYTDNYKHHHWWFPALHPMNFVGAY